MKVSSVVSLTDPGSDSQDGYMSAGHPCQSTVAERGATLQLADRSLPVECQLEPPGKVQRIKFQ